MSRMVRKQGSKKKFLRISWRIVIAIGTLLLLGLLILKVFLTFISDTTLGVPSPDAAYLDADNPTEYRVEDLLARMSLKEKVGQMALVDKNSVKDIQDVSSY